MLYKCKYFKIKELVPPKMLVYYEDLLWNLFDIRMLKTIDTLREMYGVTYINTSGNTARGFRGERCTVGARFSQHRYGRAFDLIFKDHEATVVRDEILNMSPYTREVFGLHHIKRIEEDVPWLHIDCGNSDSYDIITFKGGS